MRPLILIAPLIAATAVLSRADLTVVADGAPVATIHHLDQEGAPELAAELQHYLQAISDATVPIEPVSLIQLSEGIGGKSLLLIYGDDAIGAASLAARGMPVADLQPNGFVQSCDGKSELVVAAKDLAGLRYGVYDLLEQLGVRWYMPTELGEEIPHLATIGFGEFGNIENPDFILRDMWLAYGSRPGTEKADYETWRMRNRMGGVRAKMGHALGSLISPSEYADAHPDYFPLIDGVRMIPTRGHDWQPCTTNPDVIRIVAEKAAAAFEADPELWSFSISPNDGWGGWCECDDCAALDPPEFAGDPRHGKARRMLVFANAVAERLRQTHPDRHVAFYAYAPTVEPPTDMIADPQVAVAVAHYGSVSDKFRPITDPTSPRNAGYIPIIEGWAKVTDEIFAREYYTGLVNETDGLARVAAAYALVEDIPWYHEHHVVGINSEALGIWGNAGLNFYLAAKMMWDVDTYVPAVLDDYFAGMYGPAAAPMREYFETLRDIARERFLKSNLFTDEDFPPLRALLDRAAELAATDKQRARVQLSLDHFEYVLLLRRMYEIADAESIAAVAQFVDAHPDSLGFDRTMHAHAMKPPDRTEIPADLIYRGPEVTRASDEIPEPGALPAAPAVRGMSVWLVIGEPGEPFEVTITPRQMGRYMEPTAADLTDPSRQLVDSINVGPKATGTIAVEAAESGTYVLRLNPGRMAARAACTARAFVLVGSTQNYVGPTPRLYFLPAPDAESLYVGVESTPPGETAAITVWDPSGRRVFTGSTHDNVSVVGETFALTSANRGAWSLKVDKVPDGYIEDAVVTVRGALPYFATDPARLVRPTGD